MLGTSFTAFSMLNHDLGEDETSGFGMMGGVGPGHDSRGRSHASSFDFSGEMTPEEVQRLRLTSFDISIDDAMPFALDG